MPGLAKLTILTASLLAALSAKAQSASHSQPALVRDVVAFGASVTQATFNTIPGMRPLVWGIETYGRWFGDQDLSPLKFNSPLKNYRARGFGPSPVQYLVEELGGNRNQITYIGSYVTNKYEDLGSAQILSLLQGERRPLFDKATLLVGVDAFYWDAIWNKCDGPDYGPEGILRMLIREAKRTGKVVVLGTVPQEIPVNVRIDSRRTGVKGLWQTPNPSCVRSLNRTLHQYCTPDQNCYLVDLKAFVDDLNCGIKIKLKDGSEYGLFELRPDGVHQSDAGARAIAEKIIEAFERNPTIPSAVATKN
jgi:hypothetical protein